MADEGWLGWNQKQLIGAIARVRSYLESHLSGSATLEAAPRPVPVADPDSGDLSALEVLRLTFGLSPFEEDLLLLCAGVELDANFARLVGAAVHASAGPAAESQSSSQPGVPSFSLALAALPGAHWSALSPAAPLRRWRFIEVGSGESLMTSPLHIDEWVLHFLTGVNYLDERLQSLVTAVPEVKSEAESLLPESQHRQVKAAAQAWFAGDASGPILQLGGSDPADQMQVAGEICAQLGMRLYVLRSADVPANAGERAALACLWEREAALKLLALLIDCRSESGPLSDLPSTASANALSLAERLQAHVMLMGTAFPTSASGTRLPPEGDGGEAAAFLAPGGRAVLPLEISKPHPQEQKLLWKAALGEDAARVNGTVEALVEQFNLSALEIQQASAMARRLAAASGETSLEHSLWQACRGLSRPRLEGLAERIEPIARWDDLVLPPAQMQLLHSMAAHVRNRATVYERWGFASRSARGLGISALFAGGSGTGKTMAAEVLANDLGLDLYRIDLSAVVSKYIGETEKNLRRIFDVAEGGGAILLFDEADALFGKRSEVQDSHDRYANIEVSYLLQRMEAYRGLAILTTNMKSALDPAFLRRLRFIVNFPFPDQAQRSEIWRRIFPAATPLGDLDVDKLARLAITGGHIRNIALHAAFLAADQSSPVNMSNLLQAARSEYAKMEKSLSESEVREWVTGEEKPKEPASHG